MDEAKAALIGVWRLIRFDRSGISGFDPSIAGTARSCWAYALALPALLIFILFDLDALPKGDNAVVSVIAVVTAYIATGAAFPLAALAMLRWLGRDARWPLLVTGYNWLLLCRYIAGATLLVLIRLGMPDAAIWLLLLFRLIVEGFMFEVILDVGVLAATALVLLDFVISYTLAVIAHAIG